MAIDVSTTYLQHSSRTFSDATGWHVDDYGHLHVTQTSKGNVATFHAGAWVSVERVADKPEISINTAKNVDAAAAAQEIAFGLRSK